MPIIDIFLDSTDVGVPKVIMCYGSSSESITVTAENIQAHEEVIKHIIEKIPEFLQQHPLDSPDNDIRKTREFFNATLDSLLASQEEFIKNLGNRFKAAAGQSVPVRVSASYVPYNPPARKADSDLSESAGLIHSSRSRENPFQETVQDASHGIALLSAMLESKESVTDLLNISRKISAACDITFWTLIKSLGIEFSWKEMIVYLVKEFSSLKGGKVHDQLIDMSQIEFKAVIFQRMTILHTKKLYADLSKNPTEHPADEDVVAAIMKVCEQIKTRQKESYRTRIAAVNPLIYYNYQLFTDLKKMIDDCGFSEKFNRLRATLLPTSIAKGKKEDIIVKEVIQSVNGASLQFRKEYQLPSVSLKDDSDDEWWRWILIQSSVAPLMGKEVSYKVLYPEFWAMYHDIESKLAKDPAVDLTKCLQGYGKKIKTAAFWSLVKKYETSRTAQMTFHQQYHFQGQPLLPQQKPLNQGFDILTAVQNGGFERLFSAGIGLINTNIEENWELKDLSIIQFAAYLLEPAAELTDDQTRLKNKGSRINLFFDKIVMVLVLIQKIKNEFSITAITEEGQMNQLLEQTCTSFISKLPLSRDVADSIRSFKEELMTWQVLMQCLRTSGNLTQKKEQYVLILEKIGDFYQDFLVKTVRFCWDYELRYFSSEQEQVAFKQQWVLQLCVLLTKLVRFEVQDELKLLPRFWKDLVVEQKGGIQELFNLIKTLPALGSHPTVQVLKCLIYLEHCIFPKPEHQLFKLSTSILVDESPQQKSSAEFSDILKQEREKLLTRFWSQITDYLQTVDFRFLSEASSSEFQRKTNISHIIKNFDDWFYCLGRDSFGSEEKRFIEEELIGVLRRKLLQYLRGVLTTIIVEPVYVALSDAMSDVAPMDPKTFVENPVGFLAQQLTVESWLDKPVKITKDVTIETAKQNLRAALKEGAFDHSFGVARIEILSPPLHASTPYDPRLENPIYQSIDSLPFIEALMERIGKIDNADPSSKGSIRSQFIQWFVEKNQGTEIYDEASLIMALNRYNQNYRSQLNCIDNIFEDMLDFALVMYTDFGFYGLLYRRLNQLSVDGENVSKLKRKLHDFCMSIHSGKETIDWLPELFEAVEHKRSNFENINLTEPLVSTINQVMKIFHLVDLDLVESTFENVARAIHAAAAAEEPEDEEMAAIAAQNYVQLAIAKGKNVYTLLYEKIHKLSDLDQRIKDTLLAALKEWKTASRDQIHDTLKKLYHRFHCADCAQADPIQTPTSVCSIVSEVLSVYLPRLEPSYVDAHVVESVVARMAAASQEAPLPTGPVYGAGSPTQFQPVILERGVGAIDGDTGGLRLEFPLTSL
jgi:hypothetical protein